MSNAKYAIYTEGEVYTLISCFHTLEEAQALVKEGQVIVVQTGTDWPAETISSSEIETSIYKGDIDMNKDTSRETNQKATEVATQRINTIMDTLIDLRQQTDMLGMKKAKLLVEVKDGKLYKDGFGNFGAFCNEIGYHRSTVCTLIDCYRIPQIRENYPAIGARAGKMLVQATNSSMAPEQVSELIVFAIAHKSSETCKHVDDKMKEHYKAVFAEGEEEDQDHIESLPSALVRQAGLIRRRKALAEELIMIDDMINSIGKYIQKLTTEENSAE